MTEDPTKFKKEPVPEEKPGSKEFSGSEILEAAYRASEIKAGKIDDLVDFASLSMKLLKKTEKLREDDKAHWAKEKKALEDAHQKEIIKLQDARKADIIKLQDAHLSEMDKVNIDVVTGILRKEGLMPILSREFAALRYYAEDKSDLKAIMFIVLDVNDLKPINDIDGGHLAGDQALLACANKLKKSIKVYDPVFRTGGDEFLAILPIKTEDTDSKLNDIFKRVQNDTNDNLFIDIGDRRVFFTVSMGYKSLRKEELKNLDLEKGSKLTDKELYEKVLAEADAKMYEDKVRIKGEKAKIVKEEKDRGEADKK